MRKGVTAVWLLSLAFLVRTDAGPADSSQPQAFSRPELHHILIEVADLKKSLAFYRDCLGLSLASQSNGFAMLESANAGIYLWQNHWGWEKPHPAQETRVLGIYPHFEITDAVAAVERFRRAGYIIVQEPHTYDWGSEAFVRDPDGYVIALIKMTPKPEKSGLPLRVAKAYGADSFVNIDKIKYTFNVKFNGKTVSRSWLWDISAGRVTLERQGAAPFSYSRTGGLDTSAENVRTTDALFINDQYWLLFPLHLAWDASATISVEKNRRLPIGNGVATCVSVTFPPAGGYTPGDAFDLFLDKSDHVAQWAYRRGNARTPNRTNRWEENRWAGPLLVSLDRPGADSTFRVWFTGVAVQMKGSHVWLSPK